MTFTDKTALVLAAFGSRHEQAENFAANMKAALEKRCPNVDIFIAFTSKTATGNRRENGRAGNALAQVLSELASLGYVNVAVQSLHVAPGLEFDMLHDITGRFAGMPKGIRRTAVGFPLIHDDKSAEQLAGILTAALPPERKKTEAVVFVGHGARSLAGTLAYPALQAFLRQKDPNLFVGTLEGMFTRERILALLRDAGIENIWLNPLLASCGTHVRADIFGPENSWKTFFEENGISCAVMEETLFARPEAVAMWVDNAVLALRGLETE